MLKPAFPYYGAKTGLAGRVVDLLGEHRIYAEPYAGSAAVLLAKAPSRHETINDLDGDVVNYFTVLRDHPAELEEALALTPYARDEFTAAARPAVDPIERARRFAVRTSQSYNAAGHGGSGWAVPSVSRNQSRPRTFASVTDTRLAAIAARLRLVAIENTDALAVIDRADRLDAAIYVDPPYLASTRATIGSGTYRLDAADESHHAALLARLRAFSGTVVLSGYDCDLYRDALGDWRRVDVDRARPSANGSGRQKRATEVLWTNRALVPASPEGGA